MGLRAVGGADEQRLPLRGIAGELLFTGVLVYWTPAQDLFGTAVLPGWVLLLLLPLPVPVGGLDELPRARRRGR